jgi:hypothetical protein
MRKTKELEFWVSNISNMNVSVGDLFLTIHAYKNVNLLDKKHYSLTLEQLTASAESGSLFKKRDKLKVRKVQPEVFSTPKIQVSDLPLFLAQKKLRSSIVLEEPRFEELEISEEEFVNDIVGDK